MTSLKRRRRSENAFWRCFDDRQWTTIVRSRSSIPRVCRNDSVSSIVRAILFFSISLASLSVIAPADSVNQPRSRSRTGNRWDYRGGIDSSREIARIESRRLARRRHRRRRLRDERNAPRPVLGIPIPACLGSTRIGIPVGTRDLAIFLLAQPSVVPQSSAR